LTDFGKNPVCVTQHVRSLPGGSHSILAQASDGLLYVVKLTYDLQCANLSFNESAGTELYRAYGLPVPPWKPLLVTDAFIDRNPDCWKQTPVGWLRPDSGLCFGSSFLGGEGTRLLEILPGTSFSRVRNRESFWLAWLIDICAQQVDNRQAFFVEDAMGWLYACFVDQGHLFCGPNGEQNQGFLASRYLDLRIYERVSSDCLLSLPRIAGSLDVDRLWRQIQTLPEVWKTEKALNRFWECLGRLSNDGLLQNMVDTMVDAHERAPQIERIRNQDARKTPKAVLRLGVSAAGVGQCLIEGCVQSRARA
jgi:hypothetical protein